MPGEYASFAIRAVSLGRKRGRPPVLSSNAFYPFAAERRLASLLKAELSRSLRESLASALGRLADAGDGDGWTEEFLSGTDRAASDIVLNAREAFSRFSEMTVGTPYYPPDVESRVKEDWKAEFLACCKSADADAKADIARALTEAKGKGWNRAQAEAAVLERLDPKYAKRAELIARTETGKLNNAATMATYRSAGVEYYVWLATPDERTRPAHAALNGRICAVGDPDHWYEDNPDDPLRPLAHGRGREMYHGDPGTDFQCRCTSVPWDPRIDSRYSVREIPEPERKPTELETAREEAETAKRGREEAEAAKKEAERKLEILRAANARHAGRISGYRERLEEKLRIRRKNWEIKYSLPSESWKAVKLVGQTYATAVKEKLSKRPSEYLTACRLLKNSINIKVKPKTAYFTAYDNKISLYMGCASTNPLGPGKTILHEHGHALDYAIGVACGYGKEISETMEFGKGVAKELQRKLFKEADQFIKKNGSIFPFYYDTSDKRRDYLRAKFIEGYKLPNGEVLPEAVRMTFATLETATNEIRHSQESAAISDIINGVSRGKLSLGYGHSDSYWNFDSIGWESFTHFGTLSESEPGLAFLKKYLANQLDQWNQMVKLGADKAPSLEKAIKSR